MPQLSHSSVEDVVQWFIKFLNTGNWLDHSPFIGCLLFLSHFPNRFLMFPSPLKRTVFPLNPLKEPKQRCQYYLLFIMLAIDSQENPPTSGIHL